MKRIMTLQETQQASLVVLKELDRICEERNYKYWISFGTLIGAIRHQGFIPWDDDIDIALPREDYDALIQYLCSEYKSNDFEIHTYFNNRHYPFLISRFCDKSHELDFYDFNYKSGCFVDIYPFDGMGKKEDLSQWKRLEPKLHAITKCVILSECKSLFYGRNIACKIANFPQTLFCKVVGKMHYINKLENYRKKYSWDESDYVGIISWSSGTYCYPKESVAELERIQFEGIMVNIPKGYDAFLRCAYGDYMQLPPEDKRVPYHGYNAYNID